MNRFNNAGGDYRLIARSSLPVGVSPNRSAEIKLTNKGERNEEIKSNHHLHHTRLCIHP